LENAKIIWAQGLVGEVLFNDEYFARSMGSDKESVARRIWRGGLQKLVEALNLERIFR
jgi:hypothetical protein